MIRTKIVWSVGALAAVVSILIALTIGFGVRPAMAVDGRVPDSRPGTPGGEITAIFWHGLNRDPDPSGYANYMSFVNQNCRWGVLDGSFKILNSAEAHNTWRNDPRTLAGMLYAALLNRPPDDGGLKTYSDAISQRGLEWATAAMMASSEYNRRLSGICPSRSETSAMYTWQDAQQFSRDTLIDHAKNLAEACLLNKVVQQINQLKSVPYPPAQAVGRIAWVTNQVISFYHLDGTCGAVVQMLLAARHVNEVIASGQGDNPVFIEWSVGNPAILTGQRAFTIRIGPNPTSWQGFSGKSW